MDKMFPGRYYGLICLVALCVGAAAAARDHGKSAKLDDGKALLLLAARANGLGPESIGPWHLKATFKLVDESGKVTEVGGIEEFRGDQGQALIITEPGSAVSFWRTPKGVYRSGNLNKVSALAVLAEHEFAEPVDFSEKSARDFEVIPQAGRSGLRCLRIESAGPGNAPGFSFPAYCMDSTRPIVRVAREPSDDHEFVRNNILEFKGQYVPADLEAAVAGKPDFLAHLDVLEPLSTAELSQFSPGKDAVLLKRPRVTEILRAGDLDSLIYTHRLHPLSQPKPDYPDKARLAGVHGTVEVAAVIGTDGHIASVRVLSGPPMLRDAALDSVWQWVFEPPLSEGEPMQIVATVDLRF